MFHLDKVSHSALTSILRSTDAAAANSLMPYFAIKSKVFFLLPFIQDVIKTK